MQSPETIKLEQRLIKLFKRGGVTSITMGLISFLLKVSISNTVFWVTFFAGLVLVGIGFYFVKQHQTISVRGGTLVAIGGYLTVFSIFTLTINVAVAFILMGIVLLYATREMNKLANKNT